MAFQIKSTKGKVPRVYKTIYLDENIKKKLDQIALENDTSFNNVVVSMIEYCLEEMDSEQT